MASAAQTGRPPATSSQAYQRPLAMAACLAAADMCTLLLAVAAGFRAWTLVNPGIHPLHRAMWLAPTSAIAAFSFSGLYPGIGLTAVQHIRRCWGAITLVYLLLTATMFVSKTAAVDSRGAFLVSWVFSLVLAPTGRWLCAHFLAGRSWWGVPVIVIGTGNTGRTVIRNLRENEIQSC